MNQIKIGDYVTGYGSGYWQLMDIQPKIATEDYIGETVRWKKGQVIGYWAILKKCFTAKMKPRIDFAYEDFAWIKPVPEDVRLQIETYFAEDPKYKKKFDCAEIKLQPMVTNCWLALPEDKEQDFRDALQKLPARYSMEVFWEVANEFKQYVSKPPTGYLLNLTTYPWDVDQGGDLIYFNWELIKT